MCKGTKHLVQDLLRKNTVLSILLFLNFSFLTDLFAISRLSNGAFK